MAYEYQTECFCGQTGAPQPYLKFGVADTCHGGKGGDFGMDVYLLEPAPNAPTKAGDHLGCYGDAKHDRIFPLRLDNNNMPVDQCAGACAGKGYTLAAKQFKTECWCGNTSDNWQRHGSSTSCVGGNGGNVAADVYLIVDASTGGASTGTYSRKDLGCWKDVSSNRFFNYIAPKRGQSVDECEATCKARGSVFMAIEYQVECWCSGTSESYKIHGKSSGCSDSGKGGSYAANVYQIAAGSTPEDVASNFAYESRGCFADTKDNRFFKMLLQTDVTANECANGCAGEGAAYFSLQFPDRLECWCGSIGKCDDYNMHGSSGSCENGLGGVYAGSVYKLTSVVDPCTPAAVATAAPVVVVAPTTTGRVHKGCYNDRKGGGRVFKDRQADRVSLDTCQAICQDKNSQFFAYEYQVECWCSAAGEAYAKYGVSTGCSNGMGGSYAMDVYEISYTAAPAMAPTENPVIFLGCYRDVKHTRALSKFYQRWDEAHLSNFQACKSYCTSGGYKYMGIEDLSKECFCGAVGDDYTQHGAYNGCRSLDGVSVGGYYAISVYDLGTPQTAYPTPNNVGPAVPAKGPTQPPAAAPVTPVTVATTHQDCVQDNKQNRVLEYKWSTKLTGTTAQKVLQCATHCRNDMGSDVMGVQFKYECFCGTSLAAANIYEHGTSTKCVDGVGGTLAMNIYTISNSVQPSPSRLGMTYRGCWSDTRNSRVMAYQFPGEHPANGADITKCATICATSGFPFMGYQDGKECWCGRQDENFQMHGRSSFCRSNSAGNYVGGYWSMSVYEVSQAPGTSMAYAKLGCFADNRSDRICNRKQNDGLTLAQCWTACTSGNNAGVGFAYEYGKECWCCAQSEVDMIVKQDKTSTSCSGGTGGSYVADVYVAVQG